MMRHSKSEGSTHRLTSPRPVEDFQPYHYLESSTGKQIDSLRAANPKPTHCIEQSQASPLPQRQPPKGSKALQLLPAPATSNIMWSSRTVAHMPACFLHSLRFIFLLDLPSLFKTANQLVLPQPPFLSFRICYSTKSQNKH